MKTEEIEEISQTISRLGLLIKLHYMGKRVNLNAVVAEESEINFPLVVKGEFIEIGRDYFDDDNGQANEIMFDFTKEISDSEELLDLFKVLNEVFSDDEGGYVEVWEDEEIVPVLVEEGEKFKKLLKADSLEIYTQWKSSNEKNKLTKI